LDTDKPSPIFPTCLNCVKLDVCSAIKASKQVKEQMALEYPYVELPDALFDLAKYCTKYLPIVKEEYGI